MLADKLPSREQIQAELEYRATHKIDFFSPTQNRCAGNYTSSTWSFSKQAPITTSDYFSEGIASESRKASAPMSVCFISPGTIPHGGEAGGFLILLPYGPPAKMPRRPAIFCNLPCSVLVRNSAEE